MSHHFVFVHGACHGAWCWYKLQNKLRENGYEATSIDLKGAGIDLTDPNTVSSLDEYNQPLYTFLSNLPADEKVILVGHSVGGGSVTAAMCKFPQRVSMAVYVAAAMVKPGCLVPSELQKMLLGELEELNLGELEDLEERKLGEWNIWDYTFGNGHWKLPTSMMMKAKYIHKKFYNQSPMEDYTLATTLLRPAPISAFFGIMGIQEAPEIESIPRVYVKTGKDHMFSPPWVQDIMCMLWEPSHKFVLEDSDHSAFFSVPEALYDCLLQAAASSLSN